MRVRLSRIKAIVSSAFLAAHSDSHAGRSHGIICRFTRFGSARGIRRLGTSQRPQKTSARTR